MKVLNFIQCLNLGGMEQSAYDLMAATQNRSVDWSVQSVTPAGAGIEKLSKLGIPVQDSDYVGQFGWRSHATLLRKIAHFDGDIILLTGPTLTSCAAAKRHSSKKVLGVHFVHGKRKSDLLKWKVFYGTFGNDYDAIVYHSQHILEEAIVVAPHLTHKFHLIDYATSNCSVTSEEEKRQSRQALGIPEKCAVIGNAGWLIERKRFDIFLKTCQKIKAQCSEVRFLIAGDGALRHELESLAASLGISEAVIFLGWQQNLENFYQSLDILLFNSNSDAFGRTVMEAMGYGIPAVASVLEGGPQSVLIHGENGFLIESHDVDVLSNYCLTLLSDSALYHKFQTRSVEKISQKCSQANYIESYLSIFREAMQ